MDKITTNLVNSAKMDVQNLCRKNEFMTAFNVLQTASNELWTLYKWSVITESSHLDGIKELYTLLDKITEGQKQEG